MTEKQAHWFGADPGGIGKFGVALIDHSGAIDSVCVSSVKEAMEWLGRGDINLVGAGIDSPMWWCTGPGGGRKVDEWLRKTYSLSGGEVQSANSLQGAALVQGALLAQELRAKYPSLPITETHPKALLKALKISDADIKPESGLTGTWSSDHERDAIVGAIAARQGFSELWARNLADDRWPEEENPTSYRLSPMKYFWPSIDQGSPFRPPTLR
jgi:hypothetical protein